MAILERVENKLSNVVTDEIYQDIEEFLNPHFDVNASGWGKRRWRIVQDGHGRWREIAPRKVNAQEKSGLDSNQTYLAGGGGKLVFSNNILNSARRSPASGQHRALSSSLSTAHSRHGRDYKALSTTMRSNIFPGLGNYNWNSQSSDAYTESALNLGQHSGHDLRDEFHGITRDELGAWNEASVHHERMKKSWDTYLESLGKVGRVVTEIQVPDRMLELKSPEHGPKVKTKRQTKKFNKKRIVENRKNEDQVVGLSVNENKLTDEQTLPKMFEGITEDDDFWDFYDQPFVQS